jgi:hypothetical protein
MNRRFAENKEERESRIAAKNAKGERAAELDSLGGFL